MDSTTLLTCLQFSLYLQIVSTLPIAMIIMSEMPDQGSERIGDAEYHDERLKYYSAF